MAKFNGSSNQTNAARSANPRPYDRSVAQRNNDDFQRRAASAPNSTYVNRPPFTNISQRETSIAVYDDNRIPEGVCFGDGPVLYAQSVQNPNIDFGVTENEMVLKYEQKIAEHVADKEELARQLSLLDEKLQTALEVKKVLDDKLQTALQGEKASWDELAEFEGELNVLEVVADIKEQTTDIKEEVTVIKNLIKGYKDRQLSQRLEAENGLLRARLQEAQMLIARLTLYYPI